MISGQARLRPIARLDFDRFQKPSIPGNRHRGWRIVWCLINALFFQSAIVGLAPSSVKAAILRVFGAKVGRGFVCKPRVSIKYPWFLNIADNVWLGECVWIDNHCDVNIGSNVCISQGAYIFTGNHDWNDPAFSFFAKPVSIGSSAWITAFQRVGPGTEFPAGHALLGPKCSAANQELRSRK